ncbi:uncharacterized protein LOC121809439 isoform X3 [Salvia splendens]|uniref:uncharacterized protein LOC121809439 isoform X3 n=1 Tax=Salvia splendens TaxID=180675 RepID=UPI001C27F211|nr:uncharacterized protein LOC121809439 isoform X3 [Salvia splendens]
MGRQALLLANMDNYKTSSSTSSAASSDDYALDRLSADSSPLMMSPWNHASPLPKLPWAPPPAALFGTLRRKEGHICSLAAKDGLLYTGSDSKNIHTWRDMKEFSSFKCRSGFVKAIVISGDKIFTGHQDGRIRIWTTVSGTHRQIGTLPSFFAVVKASMRPKNSGPDLRGGKWSGRPGPPNLQGPSLASAIIFSEAQGLSHIIYCACDSGPDLRGGKWSGRPGPPNLQGPSLASEPSFSVKRKAYRILFTVPVTVASAERSFSKLKLLKNYLRSTMSQQRLNGLATLCIEKKLLDEVDSNTIINDFASRNVRRNFLRASTFSLAPGLWNLRTGAGRTTSPWRRSTTARRCGSSTPTRCHR